jgi:hypothetical protein
MRSLGSEARRRLILLSPIGIIAVGYLTARFAGGVFGIWVWIRMVQTRVSRGRADRPRRSAMDSRPGER